MTAELAFGLALRSVRENRGLSQEQLAHLCQLDRTYISMLERGLKSPTLRTTCELCRNLHISLGAFFVLIERRLQAREGGEEA